MLKIKMYGIILVTLALPIFLFVKFKQLPSWKTAIIITLVIAMVIAGGLIFTIIRRRRNSTDETSYTAKETVAADRKKSEKKPVRWFGKLFVGLLLILVAYLGYKNITKQNVVTTQNTANIKVSRLSPLPLPPEGMRQEITVNRFSWTTLPIATSGRFRFQLKVPGIKLLVKCVNFLPNGTSQVVQIAEFNSKTKFCVAFPTCDEYSVKTINTEESIVYWWEE